MSYSYVTEPGTRGKVIIQTTFGDLDVELWPKEAPKAVRNFVQLALEGYYDQTPFHRVIRGFMAQGGDRSGTGNGGESIYDGQFEDELHSRLRFTHRGILAMANSGPDQNLSQFFIALGECSWLDGNHTIFGKITGDTIYNIVPLNDIETDEDDRPLTLPRITGVEVVSSPFDDLMPRADVWWKREKQEEEERKRKEAAARERVAVRNTSLLSFGDEVDEDDDEPVRKRIKLVSSHDALQDPRLSRDLAVADIDAMRTEIRGRADQAGADERRREAATGAVRDAARRVAERGRQGSDSSSDSSDDSASSSEGGGVDDWGTRMRQKMVERRRLMERRSAPAVDAPVDDTPPSEPQPQQEPAPEPEPEPESDYEPDDEVLAKARRRRVGRLDLKLPPAAEEEEEADGAKDESKPSGAALTGYGGRFERRAERLGIGDELQPVQRRRMMVLESRRRRKDERGTLARLAAFTGKLQGAAVAEPAGDDDGDWMGHRLTFDRTVADPMARTEKPDDYVVYDPLAPDGALLPPKPKRKGRSRPAVAMVRGDRGHRR